LREEIKIPQHRRLYEILRKHIVEGHYQEGNLLPSENDLCSTYKVTRPTVRQALGNLAYEGFIKKHQGKGSIVNSLPKGIGILSLESTTSSFATNELSTHIIEKPQVTPWPEEFMFDLSELEQEIGCYQLKRLRIVQEQPTLFEVTYLPNLNLERFSVRNFENNSLFDILRMHYQITIKGGAQKIKAICATPELCKHLQVKESQPLVHLQRKMETNRPNFFIYSSIFCNTERYFLQGNF